MGAWILPHSQCYNYADLHRARARGMRHSINLRDRGWPCIGCESDTSWTYASASAASGPL